MFSLKKLLELNKDLLTIIHKLKDLILLNLPFSLKEELEKEPIWKLRRRPSYKKSELKLLAYNMYFSVGLHNSLDLINQKFGPINYEQIYFLFSRLKVEEVKNHQELLSFLFGTDENIRKMLSGEFIELFLNFDYFYNHFDYFIQKLGSKMKQTDVRSLLDDRFLTQEIIFPNITGDIMKDMPSSYIHKYEFQGVSERDIVHQNLKLYQEYLMPFRNSSILGTTIIVDDMIGEVLKLNDAKALVMGYRAGNCFRMNGEASILFHQFLESEHLRLISLSTKEFKDIAMMLVARNGNVLIAQGIEISKKIDSSISREKIYYSLKEVLKQLMEQMNKEGDEIAATIIGASNNNVTDFNQQFLDFRIMPILKNANNYYNGFQNYQCLLDLADGKKLKDIKLFEPKAIYYDERETVLCRSLKEDMSNYLEIEKRLIAISFWAKNQQQRHEAQLHHKELITFCNTDWYITLFEDGVIDGTYLEFDLRAKEEYELTLSVIEEKMNQEKRFR